MNGLARRLSALILVATTAATMSACVSRPNQASGDGGVLADRVEIQNITGRTPMLDFTGAYTLNLKKGGYVRAAGVVGRARDDIGRKKRAGKRPTGVARHHQRQGRRHHRRTERMRPHTWSVSYCFCTETHLWQVWIHPP